MTDYFVYLDLPNIPEELLHPIQDIINAPPKPDSAIPADYFYFQTRLVSERLLEWSRDLFNTDCYTQYQIIREGIPIHKDVNRDVAFNYILQAGGEAATTNVYDEDKKLIFSEIVQPKKWHRLKTDCYHNVTGITSDRVAVSVELYNYTWGDQLY